MTIRPPDYKGVAWYIKCNPYNINIRCAYVDIDSNEKFYRFSSQSWTSFVDRYAPGGLTYYELGIHEPGFQVIVPDHKIIGWDYGHDIDVVMGKKPVVTLREIEDDAKKVINRMLERCEDISIESSDEDIKQQFIADYY